MRNILKLGAIGGALLSTGLALTGCVTASTTNYPDKNGYVEALQVDAPNSLLSTATVNTGEGRKVPCIVSSYSSRSSYGGLDCNWSKAKEVAKSVMLSPGYYTEYFQLKNKKLVFCLQNSATGFSCDLNHEIETSDSKSEQEPPAELPTSTPTPKSTDLLGIDSAPKGLGN